MHAYTNNNRIRDAKKEGMKVIDVDGSCLYKKHQQLGGVQSTDSDTIPDVPLSGWETVDASNYSAMSKKIPRVTHGKDTILCNEFSQAFNVFPCI